MSTTTPNLGLVKPAGNERPDVSIINANADKIDAAVGNPEAKGSLQSQVDALNDYEQVNVTSGVIAIRRGSCVSMRFLVDTTSAINDSTVFATIKESLRPSWADRDFPVISASTGLYVGTVRFGVNGNVSFVFVANGSIPTGTKIRSTFTYVI